MNQQLNVFRPVPSSVNSLGTALLIVYTDSIQAFLRFLEQLKELIEELDMQGDRVGSIWLGICDRRLAGAPFLKMPYFLPLFCPKGDWSRQAKHR